MHAFEIVRIVAGALTLALNGGFSLFLVLDYLRIRGDISTEPFHPPALLAELGTTALAVLLTSLTLAVELARRHDPPGVTQVRFELAWIAILIFLQYTSAVVQTVLYWFAYDCSAAFQLSRCRAHNMVTFTASLAIPFTTLLYFIFFLVIAARAAKRNPHLTIWRTPFRDVDWAAKQRESTLVFDRRSIASFSNKEDFMTVKSQPTLGSNTIKSAIVLPPLPVAVQLPIPAATPAAPERRGRTSFSQKPMQIMRTIRESLTTPSNLARASMSARSEASVYSTDSPEVRTGGPLLPTITRTSASTLAQSPQSPIPALGKVKYFAASR